MARFLDTAHPFVFAKRPTFRKSLAIVAICAPNLSLAHESVTSQL
jgi:hypothetical protein